MNGPRKSKPTDGRRSHCGLAHRSPRWSDSRGTYVPAVRTTTLLRPLPGKRPEYMAVLGLAPPAATGLSARAGRSWPRGTSHWRSRSFSPRDFATHVRSPRHTAFANPKGGRCERNFRAQLPMTRRGPSRSTTKQKNNSLRKIPYWKKLAAGAQRPCGSEGT